MHSNVSEHLAFPFVRIQYWFCSELKSTRFCSIHFQFATMSFDKKIARVTLGDTASATEIGIGGRLDGMQRGIVGYEAGNK